MTKKPEITPIDTSFNVVGTLNQNFENIREAFGNTLSLDGSTPNAMRSDLDMNGQDVLNAASLSSQKLYLKGVDVTDALIVNTQDLQPILDEMNGMMEAAVEASEIAVDTVARSLQRFTKIEYEEQVVLDSVTSLQTNGYAAAGDGGGALYKRVASEPSHAGKLQTADGAWWELAADVADIRFFGAVRGTTNSNAAIQAAFAYAKAKGVGIFIPQGTWTFSQTLPLWTYMSLKGEGGARKSILRLANDSNVAMIKGETTDDNWDDNPWSDGEFEGDNFWDISDLTFDGNRDNQSAGAGLRVWGRRWSLRNVVFQNIKDEGMLTKFSDGTTPLGMEARLDNIIIDRCGKDGWYFAGPHDSTINGFVVIDAGLAANDTYAALRAVAGGNGRFFGFHAWSRGWNSSRMRNAFLQESGGGACSFDNSHFEGAYTANVDLNGFPCQFSTTCMFYAAWNGKNIILGSSGHIVMGQLDEPGSGRPGCVGIQLGWAIDHKSSGNLITVRSRNQAEGVIDFTYSGGSNVITVAGFNNSGDPSIGSPDATDLVNIVITGTGGGRIYANPTW